MGGMGGAILENLGKYKIQKFQKGYRGDLTIDMMSGAGGVASASVEPTHKEGPTLNVVYSQ